MTQQYTPEREAAQQEGFFSRWNWKLARLIQTILMLVLGIWLLAILLPLATNFVSRGNIGSLGLVVLQLVLLASYLALFMGFQLFLIYFVLARTRTYWVRPARSGVRFQHYQGNPAALEAATRIVRLLQGVKVAGGRGGGSLRGVLLVGPPGAGKRYLAQAIAGEAGVPIGYLNATSLSVSRIGLGQIKVARLYGKAHKLAREYGASILLIDEIDTIMGSRSVLNELIMQIDPPYHARSWWHRLLRLGRARRGQVNMSRVLTIATTTRLDAVDAALLRAGRFDRQIEIVLPNAEDRRAILEFYLRGVRHELHPLARLVADTAGCSPLMLKQLINEAAIYARLSGRRVLTSPDVVQASATYSWSRGQAAPDAPPPDPASPLVSAEERRRLAYYDAGRSYLSLHLRTTSEPDRSMALVYRNGQMGEGTGAAEYAAMTSEELLTELHIALAGRAATEELLGMQTTSAAEDLARATRLAMWLVGMYGMQGQFFSYLVLDEARMQQAMLTGELHERIEGLLQGQYQQVRALIAANREAVTLLAEALLLREELRGSEQIDTLLVRLEARHPFVNLRSKARGTAGLVARRAPPRAVVTGIQDKPLLYAPALAEEPVPPIRMTEERHEEGVSREDWPPQPIFPADAILWEDEDREQPGNASNEGAKR